MYHGFVTATMEHGTVTQGDDPETLASAADNYVHAPDRLKNAIITAARDGMTPAKITRAIGYAYTYEYVARLIRADRDANPGEYKRAADS